MKEPGQYEGFLTKTNLEVVQPKIAFWLYTIDNRGMYVSDVILVVRIAMYEVLFDKD